MCFDEIVPYGGERVVAPGSAVLCGAMAAARVGRRVAVLTRMSPRDEDILEPMRAAGIDCTLVPTQETSRMEVLHPTPDVDVREMRLIRNAGFFLPGDMPDLDATFVHLAGISDQEFTLPFMLALRGRGVSLSTDMQSFVRQVDPATRVVSFSDVADKQQIVSLMDRLKLDAVEAAILTGESDLEAAARRVEAWGCPEVLITRSEGVLARVAGRTFYERFSNRSTVGRTGRGDTTFAGYMAWRIEHGPAESLRFAAALVSIKMEKPGPFSGTLQDVLDRMALRPS